MSISFLSEADLKTYQTDCELWASSIKEEVDKLMATDIVEQGFRTKALLMSSESKSLRKKHNTFLRILNSCSTFNYEKAWKETRKIGYVTLLDQSLEYRHWKVQPDSCTLVCSGKLGSGKSVLLANMVDDINLHVQNERLPVAYFFCQHDNQKSLEARTIMGCLARQLLCTTPLPSGLDDFADITSPAVDIDGVVGLLLKILPPRAYFIIDGLDECDDRQREILASRLRRLQDQSSLLVCLSFRSEADNTLGLYLEQFAQPIIFQIPDNNTDIEDYITAELERRVVSGKLKLGEPTLILEIREVLLQGAQGMFLWVVLQIESLCAEKTDMAIRQALADLPRDLPDTFSRILQKSEALGKPYQEQTLKLIIAARRPLTTDELREALSVVLGDTDWKPAQILNEVYSALACCGSLIIVEEEDSTVRLVHHSVKQFLLGGLRGRPGGVFTLDSAMRTMGGIIVTYLNYGVFDTQLSTRVVPRVMAGTAPSKIVHSTLDRSRHVRKVALWLLRSREQSEYNIGNVLADESRFFNAHSMHQFHFFPYAKSYWFQHIKCISREEQAIYGLLRKLLRGSIIDTNTRDENGQTPLSLAAASGYEAVLRLLLDEGADFESRDCDGRTPLSYAAASGYETIVLLLLHKGADIESLSSSSGWTPLFWAAANGREVVVRLLLDKGANFELWDCNGCTPLLHAAANGYKEVIQLLLDEGVNIESRDYMSLTPLLWAAQNGHKAAVQLLLDKGANFTSKDLDGRTPLSWAAAGGSEAVTCLLLDKDANIDSRDYNSLTPLLWAAQNGHKAAVQLLLDKGANFEAKDTGGRTPLSLASANGHEAVVRLLQDRTDQMLRRRRFDRLGRPGGVRSSW